MNDQNQDEHERVHHTGNGRPAAVFDVGGGAGDGSGGGDAAEQGGGDVSGALSRQLHIGAVSAVDHAVCHDAGKQGFDRRQNRDRERIR